MNPTGLSYVVLCGMALAASGLTLFSGFGLGTILTPVFAIFFPIEVAIASTAMVHFANNLFKLAMLWRKADLSIVTRFAAPGAFTAVLGAMLLKYLSELPVLAIYVLGGKTLEIEPVKVVIGGLIGVFALFELIPSLEGRIRFDRKHLSVAGALSGFFGGLSGNQGALRSAALVRCGLDKAVFIATGVVCAVVVDAFRLVGYGATFYTKNFSVVREAGGAGLVGATTVAAFVGAFAGARLVKKVTMETVQWIVGVSLLLLALGLTVGLI
ncbi:MAG: sulfite exporter TauE/SafE family protein [Pseudomonadota bacterium]